MSRSAHPIVAVVFVALLLTTTDVAAIEQIRVVWHDEPQSTAVVSWSTSGAADTKLVWDRERPTQIGDYDHEVTPSRSGEFSGGDGTVYHHSRLTGLNPSEDVHFRIMAGEEVTRPLWFRTAPDDARPFVLLYGGDSRSDSKARRRMNVRMRELMEADESVIALAHGGDYVYTGSSWAQWDRWLDDWEAVIASSGRVLPIIPARGNHEGDGELYNEIFGFPGDPQATGDWWTTRMGQDFVLINLDSETSQAGGQRGWLEKQLEKAQSVRWIAVNYHRPAYPAVKSPGGSLYHWVPLFEQYNVDFVFESDGHVLKRTVPIRDGQYDPTGVVYLGEGGLGVPQRTPDNDRWYLQPPGMATSGHHVQALRITPDGVYYSAIGIDGEVLDTHTFRPRRRGQYSEPSVSSVRLVEPQTFEVQFDRAVAHSSAENRANYTFEPSLKIASITYDEKLRVARLKTEALSEGGHRLIIDGVSDAAGKAVPSSSFKFVTVDLDKGPVEAALEQTAGPVATDLIREMPVGEAKPPKKPPLFHCATTANRLTRMAFLSHPGAQTFLLLGLLFGAGRFRRIRRGR